MIQIGVNNNQSQLFLRSNDEIKSPYCLSLKFQ